MQITRQADYAIRAILYLSSLNPTDKAATSLIAEKQEIPPSFLAKIISQLWIAGLIHTSRGAKGGVTLARDPAAISLLDVVEAIDGPVSLNECTIDPRACVRSLVALCIHFGAKPRKNWSADWVKQTSHSS